MRSLLRVDGAAVRANVARLRAAHGGDVWAVVKADGYGHGAADVGRAALEAGAIGLGVATLGEARSLRCRASGRADHGAVAARSGRGGRRRGIRGRLLHARRRRAADGRAGRADPPEGRHRHGPVGPRARRGDRGRRRRGRPAGRALLAPRDLRGARHHLRRRADRPVPGARRPVPALSAAPRQLRGRPVPRGRPVRHGPVRDRAVRHLAARRGRGRRRPDAGADLDERGADGEGARAGRGERLRAADPGRAPAARRPRAGGLRRRLPAPVGRQRRRSWWAAGRAPSAPWRWTSSR